MKLFKKIPESYFRLLVELIVIFLSVVLAFFFEDYRESKNERNQYKSDLSIFREDLMGEIGDVSNKLDSFQVSNDLSYRGDMLKRILNLMWLDSLIDQKKATMADFRFIIEYQYLTSEFGTGNYSPLPEVIMVKYVDHIQRKDTKKSLRIYVEEEKILQKVNQNLYEKCENIYELIVKTDPYLEFDKADSILFYSKEFIWNYKEIVKAHEEQYGYLTWLAQKRMIRVMDALNKELLTLGIALPENPGSYRVDFRKRAGYDLGRTIDEAEPLLRIKDIVVQERKRFFAKTVPK